MRTPLLPIALATSILLAACGGGGSDAHRPTAVTSYGHTLNCDDYSQLTLGPYSAYSVPFGAYGGAAAYASCVAIGTTPGGVAFDAKWTTPPNVIDLQHVTYTGGLPRPTTTVSQLLVALDSELTVTSGTAALSIETWLTLSANTPCQTTLCGNMVELLINLQSQDWHVAQVTHPRVTINGRDWYMHAGNFGGGIVEGSVSDAYGTTKPGTQTPIQYRAFFQPVIPLPNQATVDVKEFISYLTDHNLIPTTLYVSNVAVMVESSGGSGELQVKNLAVTVK